MSYGHSHGRRGAEFTCPHVERRAAKARLELSGPTLEAYLQALEQIDAMTPHIETAHGIPGPANLAEVELIESVINEHVPESLHLKQATLWRMMLSASAI